MVRIYIQERSISEFLFKERKVQIVTDMSGPGVNDISIIMKNLQKTGCTHISIPEL